MVKLVKRVLVICEADDVFCTGTVLPPFRYSTYTNRYNISTIMFKTALLVSLLASASAFAPSQINGRLAFDRSTHLDFKRTKFLMRTHHSQSYMQQKQVENGRIRSLCIRRLKAHTATIHLSPTSFIHTRTSCHCCPSRCRCRCRRRRRRCWSYVHA